MARRIIRLSSARCGWKRGWFPGGQRGRWCSPGWEAPAGVSRAISGEELVVPGAAAAGKGANGLKNS